MPLLPFRLKALIAALLAVATLAGCAATQQEGRRAPSQGGVSQEEHRAHHPQGATAQPPAATGAGTADRQGGMMGGQGGMMGRQGGMMGAQGGMMGGQMDMKSMCDMHEKMTRSRTPQERSAMMDDTMKNMTPEMRQRHLDMMERQCR